MSIVTSRRRFVVSAAGAIACAAGVAFPAVAQTSKGAGRVPVIAQIADMSNEQQDVSRDFLVGSRAAWQDINARGGVRGRPVQHLTVEIDGTAAALKAAVAQLRDNPACVVLSGTTGDPLATQLVGLLRDEGLAIAHAAPWLQNSSIEVDDRTFPIFAARQEQIAHALRSLSVMGVQELGAVYASPRELSLYREDVERTAAGLKLKLQTFRPESDLLAMGQRLHASTSAILLFVGGTPELVQFTQGLDKQARQRYVIALADVNLQTVVQMGGARYTPVIATQPVPMTSQSSLQVVRSYKDILARLFDEAPTALSLAGFISARYVYEVLADLDAPPTRQTALAAFQKRATVDVGGFRVAYNQQRRAGSFVTQTMLSTDGRVIG